MRRSSRLWLPRAGHHVAREHFDFRSGRAAFGSQPTHTATPEQTPSVCGTTIAARWSLEIVPAASLKTIGKNLAMPVSLSASGNQARFVLVSAFILGRSVYNGDYETTKRTIKVHAASRGRKPRDPA
jgi:hypothetical protein